MDNMGTPGPNHPAHKGLKTPNNVVKMPMNRRTKIRHTINKIKDALFEPEQVEYKESFQTPEHSALDAHINNAIENSGHADALNAELGRTAHFETGQQEATIHSLRDQRIKRNMKAGDESVMKIINMEDPTKD